MKHETSVISARNLGVKFGRKSVLDGLDLDVPQGSVAALVGGNGAGKSTLLRVLIGALVPDCGSVRVLGLDPAREGERVRERVGYVADRLEIQPRTRGREWLEFVGSFQRTWDRGEAQRLAEMLQLELDTRFGEMSKGTRAKLALVAALAHRPELLVLDEPFSGLDVDTRLAVTQGILGHLRDEGRSVLLVSHSMNDVERVADRVLVLEQGRIVRGGELESFATSDSGRLDLEHALLRHKLEEVLS